MKKRKSLIKIVLYIMFLVVGISSILIANGIQHVEPSSEIRRAHSNFQIGHTGEALLGYAKGFGMALDAGTRSLMAKYYGMRMRQHLERRQLDAALESCLIVVKVLGKYDDEGSQSFLCLQIEEAIIR